MMATVLRAQAGVVEDKSVEVRSLKQEILELAQAYAGQGDPDFSKQKSLDPLVKRLTALTSPPPVKERLNLLHGTWKQVWGPYDYRDRKRGVDPELGIDEIYQVVFPGGYYYNVAPLYEKGDKSKMRVALLRGEYRLDGRGTELLRVKFTRYPGVKGRPADTPLWELASLAESGRLENRTTIVPTFIVKLFFGGGVLREVYTDEDLRILYGSDGKNFDREFIYVMTRVR
jgi:hypothetical protein